ncbi:helix-turn-helix domain-containing protein [Bacillus altitudinis]|uniref:helix-turn-helix domain-containing protein n=1 Tax=Bacillus altitudinis TaxID=293387 RepID=UPI00389ACE90
MKKIRKEKKLTQQYMANKLGISRPAYTAYELGKREPDHNTLIAISNILDVSIDFLLKGRNSVDEQASRILNDPETLIASRDGEITEEEARELLELILKKGFGNKD